MTDLALAQLNIARARAPMTDPLMAGFVDRLAEINALAEASPGFLWRLQDELGDATSIRAFDDARIIVNLTLWRTIEDLFEFTYHSGHVELYRARRSWFEPLDRPSLVLWWSPADEPPTLAEALRRLDTLTRLGLDARGVHPQGAVRPGVVRGRGGGEAAGGQATGTAATVRA